MVDYLRAGYEVSTRQACQVIQLARRSYYYQSTIDPQTALRIRLRDPAESRINYGYRRLHVLLRREGWMINVKRVYRVVFEYSNALWHHYLLNVSLQKNMALPAE